VPLSNRSAGVPGRLQCFGDGALLQWEVLSPGRRTETRPGVVMPRYPVGDVETGRILSGHDCRSRRGAYGTRRVCLREPHSRCGEFIDVRRLVELAAVAAKIAYAHVVYKNEDDIQLWSCALLRQQRCRQRSHHQTAPCQSTCHPLITLNSLSRSKEVLQGKLNLPELASGANAAKPRIGSSAL